MQRNLLHAVKEPAGRLCMLTLGAPPSEKRTAAGCPAACAFCSTLRICGVSRISEALRGCGSNRSGHCSWASCCAAMQTPASRCAAAAAQISSGPGSWIWQAGAASRRRRWPSVKPPGPVRPEGSASELHAVPTWAMHRQHALLAGVHTVISSSQQVMPKVWMRDRLTLIPLVDPTAKSCTGTCKRKTPTCRHCSHSQAGRQLPPLPRAS